MELNAGGARPAEVPGSQGPVVSAERIWEAVAVMLGWAGMDGPAVHRLLG